MPPLLGRFSTTNVVPSGLVMDWAMMRATVSVGPGAKGTSRVMGLVGYWALAVPATSADSAAIQNFLDMTVSSSLFCDSGAPETIRTSDPCLRRAVLYPAELRARF